jgi:DNA-binding CsgD family transcriptional regulator
MDATLGRSEVEVLEAEWHRAAGDAGRARDHAERALAHAAAPRQPLALLAAQRMLGSLDSDAGDHAAAEEHFAAALALADACRAPYERALSLLAQAESRLASGDREGALAVLDEAQGLCTPLDARPALDRAARLAARLAAVAASPTPALPAGLSAREAEVLRLLAEGLANAAIAERLALSPRTVGTHLTTIYGKLGVDGRAAAIRVALDHGLA